MRQKIKVFQRIHDTGIIAVIRAKTSKEAADIAEAALSGGIDVIELTMTVPGAIKAIEDLAQTYTDGTILLGAGTVLDAETARAVILAGADFVVSPGFNPEVVKLCHRYQKICMPGCMTATEIITALEAGVEIIKLFPGNLLGPAAVKAFKGPLPQAEFIPTGGVSLDNIQDWLESGCVAVGVGSELTKGVAAGDYTSITETARQYINKIRACRNQFGKG